MININVHKLFNSLLLGSVSVRSTLHMTLCDIIFKEIVLFSVIYVHAELDLVLSFTYLDLVFDRILVILA